MNGSNGDPVIPEGGVILDASAQMKNAATRFGMICEECGEYLPDETEGHPGGWAGYEYVTLEPVPQQSPTGMGMAIGVHKDIVCARDSCGKRVEELEAVATARRAIPYANRWVNLVRDTPEAEAERQAGYEIASDPAPEGPGDQGG